MIKLAVIGLGKMGISHLSMINAHPDVEVVAVCDTAGYMLDIIGKYTGLKVYTSFNAMLSEVEFDAAILATPSAFHYDMAKQLLDRNVHVFCEKPFTLIASQSLELADLAESKGLISQVGYHYRFVGAFQEVERVLKAGAIGTVTHVLAEAYGPVVLKAKGNTWRTQSKAGGGCLYDYAAHPINLLNWYFGAPETVSGTRLNKIFSADTDDEVYSTFYFADGPSAQLSVNWSDESHRKMTTKLTFWGTNGKIYADRQEIQVYLRKRPDGLEDYSEGWNIKYTTELTASVWFYLRGEEYSAQLDYFVQAIREKAKENINSFRSASMTDEVIGRMLADNERGPAAKLAVKVQAAPTKRSFSLFRK